MIESINNQEASFNNEAIPNDSPICYENLLHITVFFIINNLRKQQKNLSISFFIVHITLNVKIWHGLLKHQFTKKKKLYQRMFSLYFMRDFMYFNEIIIYCINSCFIIITLNVGPIPNIQRNAFFVRRGAVFSHKRISFQRFVDRSNQILWCWNVS